MSEVLRKLRSLAFYVRNASEFLILRREAPFILGLALTDRCNLSCRHCHVANTGRPSMTMQQVIRRLDDFYCRGFRELYITGGEPFLWEDHGYTLEDVVIYAKGIGYFHVAISTNGLFGLVSSADTLWVSLDGLRETHARLRGDHFEAVVNRIRASSHPKIAIVYTVNSVNRDGIEDFLQFVQTEDLTKIGVMFYFHTPYYGIDDLFLDSEERGLVISELIRLKRSGLPVFNSFAALTALREGNWRRPSRTWWLTDVDGDYVCCRHMSADLCEECGYSSCVEIGEAQRLRFSAVANLLRMW
jgi:MoaA/NifB/PqqE/SkfB family radical SAM enzyme